jgi:hypothetical protein
MSDVEEATRRRNAVTEYRKKLLQHKELESRVRSGQSLSPNPNFFPIALESFSWTRFSHFD